VCFITAGPIRTKRGGIKRLGNFEIDHFDCEGNFFPDKLLLYYTDLYPTLMKLKMKLNCTLTGNSRYRRELRAKVQTTETTLSVVVRRDT
jgi:hypothetical protein